MDTTLRIPIEKWRDTPITPEMVRFNDDGFETVPVKESGVRMVLIEEMGIKTYAVEAFGAKKKITPLWKEGGIGASPKIGLRETAAKKLIQANKMLEELDMELLVLVGHRAPRPQANGFSGVFWRDLGGTPSPEQAAERLKKMSLRELYERGVSAAQGFLTASVDKTDPKFATMLNELLQQEELQTLAELKKDIVDRAIKIVEFKSNLLPDQVCLDADANKPHATGVAIDVILIRRSTGEPLNMGSPADDTKSRLKSLRYLEKYNYQTYLADLENDPHSREYLNDFGINVPTVADYQEARSNRRVLCHVMLEVDAVGWNNPDNEDAESEYWHWQEDDDQQYNGCRAMIRRLPGPASYGAAFAHLQMAELVGPEFVF